MQVSKKAAILFLLCIIAGIPLANADVPFQINYQGSVTKLDGTSFDGTGYFKFSLLNATGDTAYWSNDGQTTNGSEPQSAVNVVVSKGKFAVKLGSPDYANMNALNANIFANTDLKLRVWFSETGSNGSYEQFSTDTLVISSAFSIHAGDADTVGGVTASQLQMRVTGTCAVGQTIRSIVADGTMSCTQESDPTITDSRIKDGVSWNEIDGIPADIADGDQDTRYTAGPGISISGTNNSIGVTGISDSRIFSNANIDANKLSFKTFYYEAASGTTNRCPKASITRRTS